MFLRGLVWSLHWKEQWFIGEKTVPGTRWQRGGRSENIQEVAGSEHAVWLDGGLRERQR